MTYNSGKGLIFDIQRFSIHDGPGIRTTVFMKGCQLRCLWCHNPESLRPYPEIGFIDSKCIGCGTCIGRCKIQAIRTAEGTKGILIDRDLCTLCGDCIEACPSGALECIGKYLTVEEVLREVKKDEPFYKRSGGGVTLSGGEPLMQGEFAYELLSSCHREGIHTALDTNGMVDWGLIEPIANLVDLILYDIKHMDRNRHRIFTGVDNELILRNLERLTKAGRQIIVRFPVIPTYNDSIENFDRLVSYVKRLGGIQKIELVPYHRFGELKYRKLGRRYGLSVIKPPTKENINGLIEIVKSYGLD